jgi:hypothetical protein
MGTPPALTAALARSIAAAVSAGFAASASLTALGARATNSSRSSCASALSSALPTLASSATCGPACDAIRCAATFAASSRVGRASLASGDASPGASISRRNPPWNDTPVSGDASSAMACDASSNRRDCHATVAVRASSGAAIRSSVA